MNGTFQHDGQVERRAFAGAVRAIPAWQSNRPAKIGGYGALFDVLSVPLSTDDHDAVTFFEKIAPGAFDRTIAQKSDVRSLVNHDPNRPLGRTKNSTLRLWQDDRGLGYEVEPNPNTSIGRDAVALVDRGDMDASSIGFRVRRQDVRVDRDDAGNKRYVRIIRDLDLVDCGPVTFPGYADTTADTRTVREIIERMPMRVLEQISDGRSELREHLQQLADRGLPIPRSLLHADGSIGRMTQMRQRVQRAAAAGLMIPPGLLHRSTARDDMRARIQRMAAAGCRVPHPPHMGDKNPKAAFL